MLRDRVILYGTALVTLGTVLWLAHARAPVPVFLFFGLLYGWPLLGIARLVGRREERRRLGTAPSIPAR